MEFFCQNENSKWIQVAGKSFERARLKEKKNTDPISINDARQSLLLFH